MKKQFKRILVVVVCSCFFFVTQVSAASNNVIFDSKYVSAVVNNSTYSYSGSGSVLTYQNNITLYLSSVKYTFTCKWLGRTPSQTTTPSITLSNFTLPVNIPAGNILPSDLMISCYYTSSVGLSSITLNYSDGSSYMMARNIDYTFTSYTSMTFYLNGSNTNTNLYNFILVNFDFVPTKQVDSIYVSFSGSSSYCRAYGFLVNSEGYLPSFEVPSAGGISEEQQAINEEVLSGIAALGARLSDHESDIAGKLEEIQTEIQDVQTELESVNENLDAIESQDSSFYDEVLTPAASDTDVIAEASSKREEFDNIMDEYSSLNAELARPDADELLPDYSNIVNGFKDDAFYDSFDVFYDNAYIMFMLLASVFFATLSFIIFGKKA